MNFSDDTVAKWFVLWALDKFLPNQKAVKLIITA